MGACEGRRGNADATNGVVSSRVASGRAEGDNRGHGGEEDVVDGGKEGCEREGERWREKGGYDAPG